MPDWPEILQAQKSASTVLVLFVPSVIGSTSSSIDRDYLEIRFPLEES
jgi:hypothetical protein